MHLYFDESGDFAFGDDGFDCYSQAALICPESQLDALQAIVDTRRAEWGLDEIHAAQLDRETQLFDVARDIARSEATLLAQLSDTDLVRKADIAEFRLAQAKKYKDGYERYKRETREIGRETHESIREFTDRMIKRVGLASQISHSEFIQAHYFVELISAALQKSLYAFHEDHWRDDFHAFHFILDGKLPKKLAAGEKYLEAAIRPALGSRPDLQIGLHEAWRQDPSHPFMQKFDREEGRVWGRTVRGAVDLNAVFEHGLQFRPSHEHAGLQLVDVVAFVVRQAALHPSDRAAQRAYDVLLPRLWFDGRAVTVNRLAIRRDRSPSRERYLPLQGAQRIRP